jgi:hypothetical protein
VLVIHRWTAVALVVLSFAVATPALAGRPPLPAGAEEVAAGQLPGPCTDPTDSGYAPNYGYYYSTTAKAWLQAPRCVPVWGNLALMPSQIASPGGAVTMTAVPNQGSNSGTYAPQTQSISWEFPGKKVSGCGPADLSCTSLPFAKAGPEWQWALFHVTMPRTFFIDSPGENCAGQHLCAGFATNAWSFAGLPPAGTPGLLPPGVTRVCIGGCKRAAVVVPEKLVAGVARVELPVGCAGAAAKVTRLRASAAEIICPLNLQATGDVTALTALEQAQEAEVKALAERHTVMAQLEKEMFDVMKGATEKKDQTSNGKFYKASELDKYIQGNAGSPEVVATLQDADSSLGGMFPPQAESASAAAARARTAQGGGPAASAVLRSMYAARPTAAEAKAYTDAVALATSATPSFDRARSRLLLSIGLIIGRRLLVSELGSKRTFTIASASTRVPAGKTRTVALKATALGGRALRLLGILGLSHRVGVALKASSLGHSSTRTIYVR